MKNFSSFDHLQTTDNPAIDAARKLYKDIRTNRIEREELEREWPEYLQCSRCQLKGNKQKYLSDNMLHIPGYSKKKNSEKKIQWWRHYCPKCAKTYKPNSERAGGKTF